MYCASCRAFLLSLSSELRSTKNEADAVVWSPHRCRLHDSIGRLQEASDAGCAICRNLRHSWAEWDWSKLDPANGVMLEVVVDQGMPVLKTGLCGRDGEGVQSMRMVGMYLGETASEEAYEILRECSSADNASTGSAASFKMARHWMDRCLKHHSKCPKPMPFLPTRVIDVGPPDGSQDPYVFEEALSPTAVSDDAKRYAALSHCWGPPPWFRTTDDTLAERRSRIQMADLPKTFQDAVLATRQMGLRYLWIDSLCIIQENEEDWKREAIRMCDYYSNAVFTITSAHSTNSHGGLFRERDGIRILPFVVDLDFGIRTAHCQFSPMSRREIVFDAEDLLLYKRAWVLQEMILSRRALIYDPDVVRWECLTAYGSERSPEGGIVRHHVVIREVQNAIVHLDSNIDVMDALGKDVPSRSSAWQHIIEDYMGRGLTKQSDRLIAIAGVAQALQRQTFDTYIAGLWKGLLPQCLTWHVRHLVDKSVIGSTGPNMGIVAAPPPYRTEDQVAPSWSFASVGVQVKFLNSLQDRPMCQVLDARASGPPQKQTGSLTIRGDTRTLYVMREKQSILEEALKLSTDQHYRYEEDYGLKQWLLRADATILISSDPPAKWRSLAQAVPGQWYPDEVIDPEAPVTFLALTQRPRLEAMPSGTRAQVVHTLALEPTNRAGRESEYRRVGYAAWEDCAWYGFDCCEYRKSKRQPYARLGKSWSRIKPPQLANNGTEAHPSELHSVAHGPMTAEGAYHPTARMRRQTVVIV